MFQRPRQPARQRFPAWCFFDELARGQQAHQIACEFLGTLSLDVQSRPQGRAPGNRAKQGPERIGLTAGDVSQLVGQHADHSFVGSQTSQKDSSELDRARLAQQDRRVVA